jgi:hypothetical protein
MITLMIIVTISQVLETMITLMIIFTIPQILAASLQYLWYGKDDH